MNQPAPPAAPPPAPPTKKGGLSTLAWIAIGCVGLIVVCLVILLAGLGFLAKKGSEMLGEFQDNPAKIAEMVVRVNPELEVVETDDEAGTITVRNKRTDEVLTVDLDELKEGRLSFLTEEGEVSMEIAGEGEGGSLRVSKGGEETLTYGGGAAAEMPSWVPVYSDLEPEGIFSMREEGRVSGAFSLTTSDAVAEVMSFYEGRMADLGFTVERSDFSGPSGQQGQLRGTTDSGERGLTVTISSQEDATQIVVNYEGSAGT